MATGGADELLRRHEEPQQATFLELFFDLVYVFAFTRVSQRLVETLKLADGGDGRWSTLVEGGETLLLLMALFWVWFLTAWMTNTFNPRQPIIQALVVATMFGSLVMAVALPRAFSERGLVFAGAYVLIQIARPLFLGTFLRGHERQLSAYRVLFWSALSTVPWLAGALVHGAARAVLWMLALAMDYAAARLAFPTPKLGRARTSDWTIGPEHLAERYRQFVLIALGESILVMGFTFSGTTFETDRSVALPVAFVITVLLWRIYFYRAGAILASAIAASRQPARLGQSAAYTHLLMMTGIVVTAVGHELVITHPLGSTEPTWLAAILGGPALFLAGRARFEFVVFNRVSRSLPRRPRHPSSRTQARAAGASLGRVNRRPLAVPRLAGLPAAPKRRSRPPRRSRRPARTR